MAGQQQMLSRFRLGVFLYFLLTIIVAEYTCSFVSVMASNAEKTNKCLLAALLLRAPIEKT